MSKSSYGGQAVIEGIVMNGPGGKAIACRKADGRIVYKTETKRPLKERWPIMGWPIIRGFITFIYSMVIGVKDTGWAALQAGEEEEQLSNKDVALAIVLAAAMAAGLFVVVPVLIGNFAWAAGGDFVRSLVEGLIRIGIFLAYVIFISRLPDIQRLFAYHGAEHKTINAIEDNCPLTPVNVSKYSRIHTRCGTSFILMSMILMIVIFTFVGQTDALHRILIKICCMPVVAGAAYELFRLPLYFPDNPLIKALTAPGLAVQKVTTKEPELDQLEVAIAAMTSVPGFKEEYGHLIVPGIIPTPLTVEELEAADAAKAAAEAAAADAPVNGIETVPVAAVVNTGEAAREEDPVPVAEPIAEPINEEPVNIVEPPPVDTLADTLMDILADVPAEHPADNTLPELDPEQPNEKEQSE